jgi:nucleoside-diphosphate-sugar epimerase
MKDKQSNSKGTTCLVTGVAGFVASQLAERLLSQGHSVIGIDCFTDYYPASIKQQNLKKLRGHERFTFLSADLLQVDLPALLAGKLGTLDHIVASPRDGHSTSNPIDYVFHLAAQAGVRASWGRSFEIYTRNNILATQALLEAAKQAPPKKFVYASSSSVYGDAETYPTSESLTPHPVSPYGVSKLAGEHLCMLYWHNYRVPTVALRYFTVYGPRQRPDMGFHKLILAILQNSEFEVYGDGEQTRDFTYVDDAIQGTIAAAVSEAVGEVFNIGGGSRVTVNQVIKNLESILNHRATVKYIETQKGDVRDTAADISKAQRLIGYEPLVPLIEGLSREARWLQDTGAVFPEMSTAVDQPILATRS